MNRIIIGTVLLLGLVNVAQAKPKTRVFKEGCDKVFPAAENLGSHKPYRLVLDGKADMILRVQTGSFWKAGASNIDVQFYKQKDDTCKVVDNSPYSGLRRNGTVFLDRLEKTLAEEPASKQASK
jgi:hypothetical protein